MSQIIDQFDGELIHYANSILRDIERAKEVVQDTFSKLIEQNELEEERIKAWLYTVTRNHCFNLLKKDRVKKEYESSIFLSRENEVDLETPEQINHAKELEMKVSQFFNRLSVEQREVMQLKLNSDLSYQEIAEITGQSKSNVGFIIHSTLVALKKALGGLDV